MTKYIVKRVALALVSLFLVCFITFFTMNAIPGGPFNGEKAKSAAVMAVLNERYGLDKPVGEQFINYMKNILHGDFGPSLKQRGREVIDIILTKFPVSAKVGGFSVLVALIVGIPVGCLAALNRGKASDSTIIVIATIGIAVPSFVVCSLSMYLFGVKLRWLPTVGLTTWKNYIMPVFALSFYPTAYIVRLMRSSMLDVLGQDYIRTARAKGVAHWKVIFVHALRNSLIPVITYVGPLTASILTGSLVIEKIFTIGGLGSKFVDSITNRDYTMIMGTTIFLAFIMILMNLVSDILYKVVDPRINLE